MLGNLLISLIAGGLTFGWLMIFSIPYAALLSIMVALFDLVPVVGSTVVGSTVAGIIVAAAALTISPPCAFPPSRFSSCRGMRRWSGCTADTPSTSGGRRRFPCRSVSGGRSGGCPDGARAAGR